MSNRHPLPWKWKVRGVYHDGSPILDGLMDAAGNVILGSQDDMAGTAEGIAVTETSGEMETLLREALDAHGMCLFCGPVADPLSSHPGHLYNRMRSLLARIDERAKGGG